MIELYALTSPNVQKIYIALEELGLPYRVTYVDVWHGKQFTPAFMRLNPNSKIPVIVDGEGPGGKPYTVFESGAILLYLAEKTGRLLPPDTVGRFDAIQWLMIQLTGIGPMFGQHVHFKRFGPPGTEYSLSRYATETLRLCDVLDRRLGQSAYLGGADYTVADIATYPWTRNPEDRGAGRKTHPNLWRWAESIKARPAVQRAYAKIAEIPATRDSAAPEDLDRIFGRGRFSRA